MQRTQEKIDGYVRKIQIEQFTAFRKYTIIFGKKICVTVTL